MYGVVIAECTVTRSLPVAECTGENGATWRIQGTVSCFFGSICALDEWVLGGERSSKDSCGVSPGIGCFVALADVRSGRIVGSGGSL